MRQQSTWAVKYPGFLNHPSMSELLSMNPHCDKRPYGAAAGSVEFLNMHVTVQRGTPY